LIENFVRYKLRPIELDEVVDSGVCVVIRHNDLSSQISSLRVGYGAPPLLSDLKFEI